MKALDADDTTVVLNYFWSFFFSFFFFSPEQLLALPKFPAKARGAVWHVHSAEHTFVVYDDARAHTYVYYADHVDGPHCVLVGSATTLPFGAVPVRLSQGVLTCLTPSGKGMPVTLTTHRFVHAGQAHASQLEEAVAANQSLGKYRSAFVALQRLREVRPAAAERLWEPLAASALRALEIGDAIHIYRAQGKAATVQTLRGLEYVEDAQLLAGHVALLLGDLDKAERLFLASSSPQEALKMHRDLLQWEQALRLANRFSKRDIPFLSREYAQQLEFQGQWAKALELYQAGLAGGEEAAKDRSHSEACRAGIARTAIRSGDVAKGVNMANELKLRAVFRDCAAALEAGGHLQEAAAMYEKGEQYEKACGLYIKAKNWSKVRGEESEGGGVGRKLSA